MTPERWQQVNDLFLAVIELEPSQRAAFLDQTCADDPALRREVESLVASDDRGCSLIEQAAVEVVAPLLADERPQLAQGQTVSHYEVLSLIGRGGMGEVYLALDKQLNRRVALKVLPIDYTRNRDRLRRFQQEAQAASALNHPNILTIHELGEIDGQQFIATEFVDGETLRDRMNSRPLPINEALDLAIQVAGALEAAHKAGIVHRDVKPENIMVRSDGYVKVLDFGLAKLTEQTAPTTSKSDTAPGLVLGTAKYMSPEQARGLEVDPRSDIFSLCVVLYEMLTGSAPFEGDTVSDLLAAILKDDPPPLIERVTGCPERLEGIIRKGLSKDRSERYISIPILLEDLRSLKEEVEIQSKLEGERRKGSDLAFADSSSAAAITWPRSISSSAEFLIGEMKQHKSLTGLAMATLFITTLSLGYVSYRFFARNAPKQQNPTLTRLTLGGFIGNPAISPDGRYIAYVSSAGDSQSIWLRQVATSSNAQVVGPSKLEFGRITFSLDGNYLFYFGRSREDEEPGLYEVPVIGGTPKRIIDGGGGRVTFASDHKRLAFVRQNHSGESVLFVANVDGTDQRTLATRKDHDSFENVAWSPDGNRITCTELFDENGTKRWKLLTIELADGSENSIKTPEFRSVGEIVWLADGSGLLMIAATEDEQPQVWQVDYPNGPARKVLNDVGGYEGLSLTADSSVLITQRSEVISNIWNQPRDDFAKARQITSGASVRDGWMGIDWTPDGRIVYSSHASGQPDIWIMNSDGSNPQQLTNNMGSVYSGLAVSPNGQYVVFVSRRAGNTNLWRIDIDGRNPKQLTFGTGEFNPIFAPDGQWVRYGFGGKTWKIPIDGGGAVLSGDGIPPLLGISLSPNGKFRANLPETNPPNINRIVIAPAIGGKSIVLNLPPGTQISRAMCWTPDSRALTYVVAHGDVTNIWSQPVDGGPAHPLTDFKADRIKSFAWSRDGKQLAFVRTTIPVELILVSNFR